MANAPLPDVPSRLPPLELIAWMDVHSALLFLSTVTVAEIEGGITKLRREGATHKVRIWRRGSRPFCIFMVIASLPSMYPRRGSPAPYQIGRGQGQAPGVADTIIAAIARQHGLTILSRNVRHFVPLGVPVLDPFYNLPSA